MKLFACLLTAVTTSIFSQNNITQFINIQKYNEENKELIKQKDYSGKTVLMGDSITEFWKVNDPLFF